MTKKKKTKENEKWSFPEENKREDWLDLIINSLSILIFIIIGLLIGIGLK